MTESLLGIPHLVSALCYHLATEDGGNIDEGYIGSRTRDALYRLYKDIAFSCLLGLNEQLPSPDDGVDGRDIHGLDSINTKNKDGALSGRVRELEQRLSVNRQFDSSLNKEPGRCDLLLPTGFGTVNDVQQTGFVCTEGGRVVDFLRCLEGTRITAGEDEENEHEFYSVSHCVQETDHSSRRIQVNRGLFVEEEPSPECIPGVCAGGSGHGLDVEGPPALGWFVDQKKRRVTHRDIAVCRGNDSVNREHKDSFSWHPSKSPVKVSIGSLFIDHSPGKMTSFEKLETKYDVLYREGGRSSTVKRGIEKKDVDSFVPEVSVQRKNDSVWSGEESRISREALLALYGIRASLAKLRGRLAMPEALARPSIARILSSFERSSTCRVSIESYIHVTLAQDTVDPITHAFANTLNDILHDIDRELVEIEWSGSDNWVQPMGMKAAGDQGKYGIVDNKSVPKRGSIFDFEDPIIALPEETDAQGGEFYGLGLSVLQLSHATSRVQSVLLRLFDFLELNENDEASASLPSGCRLLEYIYDKSLLMEGDHAALAKRLLLGAFAPYLSVIYRWAFGVRDLDAESAYTGPLSNEYVLYAPSYNGGTILKSDAWISHVGPSDIPNFLSNESRRALAVAGTQLRLLYSVSQKIDVVDDVAISLGQVRDDLHPDVLFDRACSTNKWFEMQTIGKGFDFLNGNVECAVNDPLMVGLERVEDRNGSISTSKQHIVQQWLQNLMKRKNTVGNSRRKQPWRASVKSKESACESVPLNSSLPLSMLLETSIEDLLLIQASVVSKACTSLFIDYLDIFKALEFTRQAFLGFAGDFLSEFVQALEPLVFSLEPLSLHQAKSILFEASTISSLRTFDFAQYLRINLLPGDNALTHVQEAFGIGMGHSDDIRIKSPYYSAMAPVLIPPSGINAYDCIYVSFEPPWPMGAIFSDDTLTAYAAVFNMNLRISRVLFSLKALRRLVCPRDLISRSMHREPENLVWMSRLRVIHSFLFESHHNLDSISQMYKECCSGASWKRVQDALDHKSISDERPETIHDMIDIHRHYIYDAARRITCCCSAQDINQAINSMLTTILDVRNLIEGQMREMKGLEEVVSDNDMWRQLKHHITAYYDQVEILKKNQSEVPVPATEEESILYNMLQTV